MRRIVILALSALMVVALAAPAFARPAQKGSTTIDVTPLAAAVGLDNLGILKPGELDVPNATFGIVGNPFDGTIEHVGGVTVVGVPLRNFTIDLNEGEVTGIVPGLGRVALFDLVGLDLVLTPGAAEALGAPALAGAVIGTADVSDWKDGYLP